MVEIYAFALTLDTNKMEERLASLMEQKDRSQRAEQQRVV
jgi:hypothetical protein